MERATWPRMAVLLWMLHVTQAAIPRVAVIGAGISGGSAVHFLRNLLGDEVEIVVYEASDQPGGRTLTRTFANMTVDVGGTAIYSKNKYVSGFAKLFNLPPEDENSTNDVIGIWDGSKIRIELDTDSSWLAGAKALLRYGLSPLRIIPAVRETVKKFDRIYELQDQNRSFSSPTELLMALGLFNLTQVSAYDYFSQLGVGDLFTKELIDGASRCNYNQAGNVNSFTDLISLAGAGVAGHVFGLANGTQDISKGLVKVANRLRLNDRVTEIYDAESGYVVVSNGPAEPRKDHFDGVIVATPLEMAGIKLPAEAQQRAGHGREYQSTYVTFVHGQLNASYFSHDPMKIRKLPAALFTPEDSSAPFVSFSIHKVFADDSVVVKLFSRMELQDVDVGQIFVKVFEIFRWTWKAYPKLQPMSPENWASFRLDKRALLYTSGLETSASAMEVAAIAGRNGALLMKKALASRDEFHQVPLQSEIIGTI